MTPAVPPYTKCQYTLTFETPFKLCRYTFTCDTLSMSTHPYTLNTLTFNTHPYPRPTILFNTTTALTERGIRQRLDLFIQNKQPPDLPSLLPAALIGTVSSDSLPLSAPLSSDLFRLSSASNPYSDPLSRPLSTTLSFDPLYPSSSSIPLITILPPFSYYSPPFPSPPL